MSNLNSLSNSAALPVLLAIGGHDPSGGAGIQADSEAAAAVGVHCCSAITCITVQNTSGLRALIPQAPEQVRAQCEAVLADTPVAAIKIGLIGDARLVPMLAAMLTDVPHIPVVFDPVLATGAGDTVSDAALLEQLRRDLLPRATLLTPNLPEALQLAGTDDRELAVQRLLDVGCAHLLITGTHDSTATVINRLYTAQHPPRTWSWPRDPGTFHGSGCTLASAIAARLALGLTLEAAISQAQHYVAATLTHAYRSGKAQLTPRRLGFPIQYNTGDCYS